MISVRNVEKQFGGKRVLCGVTFDLQDGEIVGLVGPSGGGKSVLLKVLGRVLKPDAGDVVVVNADGSQCTDAEGLSVGFLFQEGALFDSMTVIDNVAFPLQHGERHKMPRDEIYSEALEILREVGLQRAAFKVPGQLSGGMRRRVALARAIVSKPRLVLLDDPTGGLDPVATNVIMDLIKSLHDHYRPTIVMVSHDIRRLLPNVGRVLSLFGGTIVSDLPPGGLARGAPADVVKFLATRFDFPELAEGAKRPQS